MKKLAILKADKVNPKLSPEFGEYADMFDKVFRPYFPDIVLTTYDVQNFEYPTDLDEVDAYIITGSASGVYEELEWIQVLGDFVKKLHRQQKKLIGICFGHQLVAHVLGGKTEKSDKGWGIGVYTVELTEQGKKLSQHQEAMNLFNTHQDQVVIPAEGSEILAGNDFCPFSICKIGDHIFTCQGHIEMTTAYTKGLIDLRRHRFGEPLYHKAIDSLSQRNDKELLTKWIIDFIVSSK